MVGPGASVVPRSSMATGTGAALMPSASLPAAACLHTYDSRTGEPVQEFQHFFLLSWKFKIDVRLVILLFGD